MNVSNEQYIIKFIDQIPLPSLIQGEWGKVLIGTLHLENFVEQTRIWLMLEHNKGFISNTRIEIKIMYFVLLCPPYNIL